MTYALEEPTLAASRPRDPLGPEFFPLLDFLRLLAAVVVVVGHGHAMFGWSPGRSYLAVDLFFVLSGLVVANAYDAKLRAGLTLSTFARIRGARLYPLYALGMLISVAGLAIDDTSRLMSVEFMAAFLPGLVMLPGLFGPGSLFVYNYLYPLNLPAWSLFLELAVNLVYGRWPGSFSIRVIRLILLVSAVALVGVCLVTSHHSLGVGWNRKTAVLAIPRVSYSFFAGILIFHVRTSARFAWVRSIRDDVKAALSVIVVVIALAVSPPPGLEGIWDLVCVILVFPAVVLAASFARLSNSTSRIAAACGMTSYAIYILHWPLLNLLGAAETRFPGLTLGAPWDGLLFLVAIMALSYGLDVVYDRPMRRILGNRPNIRMARTG